MKTIDQQVKKFLAKHHLLTLCTLGTEGLWTAHCFYAFDAENMRMYFATDPDTQHGKNMIEQVNIAAAIGVETKIVGSIEGIQLTGKVTLLTAEESSQALNAYLKRFPYAIAMKPKMWAFHIQTYKYTNNLLGFGKKLYWSRTESLLE